MDLEGEGVQEPMPLRMRSAARSPSVSCSPVRMAGWNRHDERRMWTFFLSDVMPAVWRAGGAARSCKGHRHRGSTTGLRFQGCMVIPAGPG
ncbi:MAG: hypothetical protein OEY70_16780, partial [Acidimicrobiia bacterium]|nr:hypothetical protein [Acidimicrobiia bacterium]